MHNYMLRSAAARLRRCIVISQSTVIKRIKYTLQGIF